MQGVLYRSAEAFDAEAAGQVTREGGIRQIGARLLQGIGCPYLATFSENRATRITPGWPDLYVILPQYRDTLTWESKAHGGIVSPLQEEFAAHRKRLGRPHVIGGVEALTAELKRLGVL